MGPRAAPLSIVVVSFNSADYLPACLGSLQQAPRWEEELELFVVDNASSDGSADLVARDFPRARLLRNTENVGYARAVNQGIAATSGRYVLVMNPDCEVRPGAVATLVEHLDRHPGGAVAGPRILNPDGSLEYSARAFPDHFTFLFNRYSLLTRLFPNNRFSRRYLLSDWDHLSVREVDWLSGAFLVVRRAAIAQVGAMDEAYFMFNEDVDWCRRMKQAGWSNVYVPDAQVVHHVGASRGRVAPRVIVERHRGMIHYFHKHHPTNPVMRTLADALILARAGVMLVGNAFKPAPDAGSRRAGH
jgi:GT2 family glycosyltransferase